MSAPQVPVRRLADLTDPSVQVLFNATLDDARAAVASGDPQRVSRIEGHFALVGRDGHRIRMARTLAVPMRYFIAKEADGPALVVAHRIDAIREWLVSAGLADQFHPSYTRMAPAHYLTEVALVGCPDPNPSHRRFFTPPADRLPADVGMIGTAYMTAAAHAITRWLRRLPADAPVGVCFSGGIDSGAVFLLTYHAMRSLGISPSRLKAFTLCVDGGGADLAQAREFLRPLGLELFLEPVEVGAAELKLEQAVRVVEDYKPLDVQAAAMMLALCQGIRRRYPDWRHLLDGDGGDENLKDYPIEENPELTIRSVLNNRLLYHEGWGIDAIKHSLTYSGGLSRGCTRGFCPARATGFTLFSPLTLPSVVAVCESIPFADLTDWQPARLYALKGRVVAAGIEAVTGMRMPVFAKRRFQHGAAERRAFAERFPPDEAPYRRAFQEALCG